jgi:hypothetical protein
LGLVIPFEDKDVGRDGIGALVVLTRPDMERVNAMILSRTGSEVTMIPEVANHLISSGGKRLRPMLTLATANLCGYRGDGHVKLAASVEFMHTATLLHDDVVDQSDMRRGKLAARMLWGNEASVLVGDFLLGQALTQVFQHVEQHFVDRTTTLFWNCQVVIIGIADFDFLHYHKRLWIFQKRFAFFSEFQCAVCLNFFRHEATHVHLTYNGIPEFLVVIFALAEMLAEVAFVCCNF